jgi:hypothetical protein
MQRNLPPILTRHHSPVNQQMGWELKEFEPGAAEQGIMAARAICMGLKND